MCLRRPCAGGATFDHYQVDLLVVSPGQRPLLPGRPDDDAGAHLLRGRQDLVLGRWAAIGSSRNGSGGSADG